jgi:transposase-like protein
MAHYPTERREALIRRMQTESISIAALSQETGIAQWTLYRWRGKAKTTGEAVSTPKKHEKLSAMQKIAMVAETAGFNEAELGEYCRKHGLYPEQIKTWRDACEQATGGHLVPAKQLREAMAADQKRIKELERELHRKEKALSETAALLTLRKKAAAIWGEGEDA